VPFGGGLLDNPDVSWRFAIARPIQVKPALGEAPPDLFSTSGLPVIRAKPGLPNKARGFREWLQFRTM
jgi:hypothetical protein